MSPPRTKPVGLHPMGTKLGPPHWCTASPCRQTKRCRLALYSLRFEQTIRADIMTAEIKLDARGSNSASRLNEIADALFTGDAAERMRTFPDGCIDLIVTSPPYWTAVQY